MYSRDLAYVHDAGFGDFARAAAPGIRQILRRAGCVRGRVVEFGCGSGELAIHLHRAGYEVLALDVSPAMIALARRRAPAISFRVVSLEHARLPRCNAIVGIGEVVTYVPGGAAALRRFFAKAHDALAPGGVLVFDFIESARRRTYRRRTIVGRDWTIAVSATYSAPRRTLTRRMRIARRMAASAAATSAHRVRQSSETHRIHVYDRRTMLRLLERSGFTVSMSRSYGRCRLLPGDVVVVAHRAHRRAPL